MKDNQDIAGSMTSESYEALRKQIEDIVKHAKYNAVIFTGLDTDGAHKNTEFEVDQILHLLANEIEAARIDEVESAWRRAPKDENCVATDIVTVYLERRLASLQAAKKGDDGE